MSATREIALLLKVNEETAEKARDQIDEDFLLDWSECTDAEFAQAARTAYLRLTRTSARS